MKATATARPACISLLASARNSQPHKAESQSDDDKPTAANQQILQGREDEVFRELGPARQFETMGELRKFEEESDQAATQRYRELELSPQEKEKRRKAEALEEIRQANKRLATADTNQVSRRDQQPSTTAEAG